MSFLKKYVVVFATTLNAKTSYMTEVALLQKYLLKLVD